MLSSRIYIRYGDKGRVLLSERDEKPPGRHLGVRWPDAQVQERSKNGVIDLAGRKRACRTSCTSAMVPDPVCYCSRPASSVAHQHWSQRPSGLAYCLRTVTGHSLVRGSVKVQAISDLQNNTCKSREETT